MKIILISSSFSIFYHEVSYDIYLYVFIFSVHVKHQLKNSFASIHSFLTKVLKITIPQLMHMYIFTKWKVPLVIAKEIMALITAAPLGVCLQALLEQ